MTIPYYNPADVAANLWRLMNGDKLPMTPWRHGFKGKIKLSAQHKYDVYGVAQKINDTTVEITEV